VVPLKLTEIAWDDIRIHSSVLVPIPLFQRFIRESRIDTWIVAQGSMSNANICRRLPCSKKVEKHWLK